MMPHRAPRRAIEFTAAALFVFFLVITQVFPVQASGQLPPTDPSNNQTASPVFDKIVVKFKEGTGVRLRNGQLTAPLAANVNGVRAQVAGFAGAVIKRHFSRPEISLDQERQTAMALSGKQLNDLNLYYTIEVPPGATVAQAQALVNALLADPAVQTAYIQPIPVPAGGVDLSPATPIFQFDQGYLKIGSQGIDSFYAWGIPGGKGQGVRIIDVEGGWELDHEDLPTSSATDLLFGVNYGKETGDAAWYQHGTAVLGEMLGIKNGYGVTGIVPSAEGKVVSIWTSLVSANTADAINQATANTASGDLILLELQQLAPGLFSPCNAECSCPSNPNVRYIPVEYYLDIYDAILNATTLGRVVVEAAGNGYNDLDDAVWGGIWEVGDPNFRDSGAIMVGAGYSGTGGIIPARRPHCYSNFGSRVDVQGWGDSIYSTGYGGLFNGGGDVKQYYTSSFNGTSGASPIVTGVAAALQGISKDRGSTITPATMRTILKNNGYAQAPSTRQIGPLPNLRLAIETTFPAVPIQVLNTNDSGVGSLRAAITQANSNADTNVITFDIPGAGVRTINLTSALPDITSPVVIDGYTQPGAARATTSSAAQILIELNGAGAGAGVNGLYISAGNSTVRGLAINRFDGAAIYLTTNGSNTIEGNFLGTNAAGDAALPNQHGVRVNGVGNNFIGGVTVAERNIISGNNGHGISLNGPNNTVVGNYVGLNGTGTGQLGNTQHGVYVNNTSGNTIGSSNVSGRNLLSGNAGNGVYIAGASATNNSVIGNYIGTDAAGTTDYGNALNGVQINGGANNRVGGTANGEGNRIAFNDQKGVLVEAANGNAILQNSMFDNTAVGIDLASGANQNRPAPTLTNVTPGGSITVYGTLTGSAASALHRVEFFANTACDASGAGEGQTFLGFTSVTTNGSGNATFSLTLPTQPNGTPITATATDATSNTSRFSTCFAVNDPPLAPVLISPVSNGGLTITSLNPTYVWSEAPGSTAYSIVTLDAETGQIRASELYDASVCTAGVCSGTPNAPEDTLPTNRIYAWYATAFGSGSWGPFSPPGIFLASVPPPKPTFLSPTGNYIPNPETLTPQYSWTEAPGSVLYMLAVFDMQTLNLQFSQVYSLLDTPNLCPGGICTVTPNAPGSTLTNGGSYGVFVIGLSYAGAGPWSDGAVFNLFIKPGKPVQIAPSGMTTSQPLYQWNKVQGATDYAIHVYNSGSVLVLNQWVSSASACATTPCQFQQPTPLPAGNYSWYVIAGNPAGVGPISDGLAFTVPAGPPAQPTPVPAPTFRP